MADYDYDAGLVPDVPSTVPSPSKGYFHAIPDPTNSHWVTLVRLAVPMGIAAFTRRLPGMEAGVHYHPVGSVHTDLAQACLAGLERDTVGLNQAHKDALAQAKAAVGNEKFIRAVMHDPITGGWWVHLSGPRRFANWEANGLFSATCAVFTDWSHLAGMQYDPFETDIADEVSIDIDALLRNGGVTVRKLKRPMNWTDPAATKPYYARTAVGAEREPGPISSKHLPNNGRAVDNGIYDLPYVGEPGLLQDPGAEVSQVTTEVRPVHQRAETDPDWVHPLLEARQAERMFWHD